MHIATIDVRIDGLERAPHGKRDAKEDAGAESAFAALFADVQHDMRDKPIAKGEAVEEGDAQKPVEDIAPEKAKSQSTPEKETVDASAKAETETTSEASDPRRAQAEPGAKDPAAQIANHGKLKSHAKFVITDTNGKLPTVKVDVSGETTSTAVSSALTGNNVATLAPVEAVVPFTGEAIVLGQNNAIAAVVEIEVLTAASPTKSTEAPVSTPDANEVDTVDEQPSAPATDANVSADAGVRGSNTEHHVRAVVSKPGLHAVSPKVPSQLQAPNDAASAKDDAARLVGIGDEETEAESPTVEVPKSPDAPTPKAEPQIVRTITQVVAPDGRMLAVQNAETRIAGGQAPSQHEVVVVERTTLQALPEQALRGVRFLTGNGESTMRIRLVPESLGEVRLEVTSANGEVSVKLASANVAVREILQTHAHGLQSAIERDSSSNAAVRVTVTSDVSPGTWLSSNAQRQSGRQDADPQQRAASSTTYHSPKQSASDFPRRETSHNGNLNLYV